MNNETHKEKCKRLGQCPALGLENGHPALNNIRTCPGCVADGKDRGISWWIFCDYHDALFTPEVLESLAASSANLPAPAVTAPTGASRAEIGGQCLQCDAFLCASNDFTVMKAALEHHIATTGCEGRVELRDPSLPSIASWIAQGGGATFGVLGPTNRHALRQSRRQRRKQGRKHR